MRATAWVTCPRCDGEIEVEFEVTPGEEAVWYPNDRAHPGCPPEVEIVGEVRRDGCTCEEVPWDTIEEENYDRLLEEAEEDAIAAEELAAERRMEERRDDRELERRAS